MQTKDFWYDLPEGRIAQTPMADRAASRLLVCDGNNRSIADHEFRDIIEYLHPGDVLVRNNTRVLPARLFGKREETGGSMEFLLLRRIEGDTWECLVKPGRRAKTGYNFRISDELTATISDSAEDGGRLVTFSYDGIFEEVLDRVGHMPLPPYITEKLNDKERYQTVYAMNNGSAAAPTAGLHFTPELFDAIKAKGIKVVDILLHVGLGTFRPVSVDDVDDHRMHEEYYAVSESAANTINEARKAGGRIIAVGTTSCRTLESVTDEHGIVHPKSGYTDIFIKPGYRFKAVDALVTNFHLPESTLLMLVSALMGKAEMDLAYRHAIDNNYRFFSFGDAMLII